MVATAVAVGVSAGRAFLQTRVESTKINLIDSAFAEARRELKKKAQVYIARSLKTFALRLVLKAVIIGLVLAGILIAKPQTEVSLAVLAALLAAFLIWDIVTAFPTVRILATRLRSTRFSLREALASAVATNVFASVLDQADERKATRSEALLLAAAGTTESRFKTDIADAVAKLAAEASWDDLKPFLMLSVVKAASVLSLYSLYLWTALQLIT